MREGTLLQLAKRWITAGKKLGKLERERAALVAKEAHTPRDSSAVTRLRLDWIRLVSLVLANLELSRAKPQAISSSAWPRSRSALQPQSPRRSVLGMGLGRSAGVTRQWVLGASLGLSGCSRGDDGRLDLSGGSSGASDSTGTLTTFQPTTTVDPSATLTNGSSSSDGGLDTSGTGSSSDASSSGSSGDASTTGESTTGDVPPSVQSTTPADLVTGVAPIGVVEVTFSELMAAATITTNTADDACSGSLQLSADGFATCVRMAGPPATSDGQTFVIGPMASLASATTYQLRVLGDVTDAGGTPMGADFTTATGFVVRYFHTIVIDGVNDFTAEETFTTSTMGHSGYVAWDDTHVYLGMTSPDLGGSSNQVWMLGYLGGAMGTTAGVQYNTQQPLLPFDARWHVRWRASDDFGGALEWTGAAWTNPGFGPTAGSSDIGFGGSFVELRVSWADLEDPVTLPLHLGMLREQSLNEASWAAVPAGSYVDGYDPIYTLYFDFDVLGSTVPVDHPAI